MVDNNESVLTDKEVYQLFMLFQSLDDLKRSLLMVLCHTYPEKITISQLSELAGYSYKSKYIFKSNALKALEIEKIISIDSNNKKRHLISLNPHNSLLIKFSKICQTVGNSISSRFFSRLFEMNSTHGEE